MKTNYFSYCCLALGIFLMAGTGFSALSSSTIDCPSQMKNYFLRLAPQGWSFFTRNPREELFQMYSLETQQCTPAFYNNSHIDNKLGLSRKSRRLAFEFSTLMSRVGTSTWIPYEGVDYESLMNEPTTHTIDLKSKAIKNISPGRYLAIMRKPVPWAWKKGFQEKHTQNRYLLLEIVDCQDQIAQQ